MICHEDFVTYDARLASFTNPKKRATTANGRAGKIMRWPHGSIRPEDMAAAGMFFDPATTNPDHTICFHCGKGLDGWENGDNPFDEHLTHSRSCGWAILKAVEFGVDSYDQLDPTDPGLVEARRETFAGLWPHEDKKGWKCKTKQLVESGWVYTPTLESNDMATCLYCSLALDGWEPGDKPINEHESRSASCPVILALKRNKKSRTKNSTLGNTSLLSLQSNATYMSEQPSMDIVAEPEDSVMTTTSTTSKKPTRAKKSTTTTKGRKAKAKKEESAEPEPIDAEQDNQLEPEPVLVLLPAPTPAPAPAPAPRKRAAMNKRTSEAMEDSAMTEAEAPAPKKKTRGRAVSPAATSLTEDIHLLQVEPSTKKSGNRKAAPRQSTRSSRERESSNASFMSAVSTTQTQSMLEDIPDDEEIDKQLEADLERFTDHEDLSADSDSERRSRSRVESYQPVQTVQVQKVKSPIRDAPSNYAMFDPSPAVSEQDVEAEMKAMEVEMRASRAKKIEVKPRNDLEPEYEAEPEPGPEPELQPVPPKKGRKAAASRKVSKTKSAKDTLEPASEADPCSAVAPMEEQILPERPAITLDIHQDEDELAGGSTNGTSATVIKKTTTVSAPSKKTKAKQTNKQKPISDTTEEGRDELENRPVQIKVASKTSVVTPAAVTEKAVDDTPSPPPPHVSLKIKSKVKQAKEPEPEPEAEHETGHEPEKFLESQEQLELEVEEPEQLSQPIQGEATSPSRPATASSIPRPLPQSPRRTQAQTQQANTQTQTQTKAQTQPHLTSSPIALRSSPRLRHAIALSPSQSPQASDTENKPPLSISGVLNLPLKKVVLAPPAENVGASAMALDTSASEATPHLGHYESHVTLAPMGSPGKRTVMTNIRTVSAPWASIDVDQLFDDFAAGAHGSNTTGKDAEQREREGGDAALAETAIASSAAWIDLLQADQLSASEKDMTVEQWIHHNAAMAEKKMRQECEAMVSRFESEGSKAMRVLEGLVTE